MRAVIDLSGMFLGDIYRFQGKEGHLRRTKKAKAPTPSPDIEPTTKTAICKTRVSKFTFMFEDV